MTSLISPKDFTTVTHQMRSFFLEKGFLEVHTQNRLSILAACEDPTTVSTYEYAEKFEPLPQTGQMWLEYELLTNPDILVSVYLLLTDKNKTQKKEDTNSSSPCLSLRWEVL